MQTHRDPVASIASSCSLSQETARDWSTVFQGALIGETQLDLWSSSARAFQEARSGYDPKQFFDVDYADFVGNPHGTVKAIYDAFDLELTAEHQAAIDGLDHESTHGKTAGQAHLLPGRLRPHRGRGADRLPLRRVSATGR